MRRRRSEEEHENLERWLVSYADFITLLFAFFVVMYSISSVNEGKYRVLSESLTAAFSEPQKLQHVEKTQNLIQIGELKRGQALAVNAIVQLPEASDSADREGGQQGDDEAQLAEVASQIERVLAPYIQDELIAVKRESRWVEIEMKSGLLFSSGRAELSPESIPMLEKLADIFKTISNAIHVEGHTDNVPINTREFPSNWELSSARAASVVHQLMKDGVEPARMAAVAHGEYHPLADNGTEAGRYKNRRVTIVLQSRGSVRYKMASGQPAEMLESQWKTPAVPASRIATP
jgi:chemotaxis protein MotB